MAWTVSLQILLISSCVAFMAIAMKVSVPLALEFVVSHLPQIWNCFLIWLRPPYLYVVVNGIIITIAAASRFHHHRPDHQTTPSPPPAVEVEEGEDRHHRGNDDRHQPEVDNPSEFEVSEQPEVVCELREEVPEDVTVEQEEEEEEEEVKTVVVNYGTDEAPVGAGDEDEEDELVISRSTWTPPTRTDSSEILLPAEDKPLVSARFVHRKPAKSSPEGARVLGVSKPKRHETLENTWKAITEGRSMPISRHMKKCDTWDNRGRQVDEGQIEPFQMMKSQTFKDRTNQQPPAQALTSPPGSGKLRKEPSLSQDELNRRVEAFINKFNEEMRLQRQESLKRYMEMINGGSH